MNVTTFQTLELLKLLAAGEWRDLDDNDWAAFAGAEEGAQIAEIDDCVELQGLGFHGGAMAVASADRCEVHGTDIFGTPVSATLSCEVEAG
jgi:hypothetical protein